MRPDSRSVSFTFHREVLGTRNSPEMVRGTRNLRQRLQDRFDKERGSANDDTKSAKPAKTPKTPKEPADRAWNNISLGNVSADSRRALRNGAERLSRTISSVRSTFGTISQVRIPEAYNGNVLSGKSTVYSFSRDHSQKSRSIF